ILRLTTRKSQDDLVEVGVHLIYEAQLRVIPEPRVLEPSRVERSASVTDRNISVADVVRDDGPHEMELVPSTLKSCRPSTFGVPSPDATTICTPSPARRSMPRCTVVR